MNVLIVSLKTSTMLWDPHTRLLGGKKTSCSKDRDKTHGDVLLNSKKNSCKQDNRRRKSLAKTSVNGPRRC